MQQQGISKLALRFNQARLKNGTVLGIKVTIVGFYGPGAGGYHEYSTEAGDQVPNSWTDGTLKLDQIDVVAGVDLHSSQRKKRPKRRKVLRRKRKNDRRVFVAYPAEYRSSGVMMFIVDENGIIYEKDLGKKTAVVAKR